MYPLAVEAGVDAMKYWDMTYKEISTTIIAYSKRLVTTRQDNAVIAYAQSFLIAHQISLKFSGKGESIAIHEAFPGMFPHLEQQAAMQEKQQQDWRIMKARVEAYAAKKREQEERRKQVEVKEQNGDDN